MNNYFVQFVSQWSGAVYMVGIGGGTGNSIMLKGGMHPFFTQEDDDDDMFAPIRKQSGYLRIVDDGKAADGVTAFDWHDMIPAKDTSRPVTLARKQGNNWILMWRGYMQAQDFGSRLYGNPQEREFPIQCVLSVLDGQDINYTETGIHNFAYLLKQVLDGITNDQRPEKIVIQSASSNNGNDAMMWLQTKIDWSNFAVDGDDGLEARFTLYECLEEMCRFWGWTARTWRGVLYLTCADDAGETNWMELTYSQLTQLANGSTFVPTTSAFGSASIGDTAFASVDQDDFLMRGYNRAKVTADANALPEYPINPFDDLLEVEMNEHGLYEVTVDGQKLCYTTDVTAVQRHDLEGGCNLGASFNILSMPNGDSDRYETVGDVIRFIKKGSTPLVYLETKYDHCYHAGMLRLYGYCYVKGKYSYTDTSLMTNLNYMWMSIGIGENQNSAKWFNPDLAMLDPTISMWSSNRAIIKGKFDDQGMIWAAGDVVSTNFIKTDNQMHGKLFIMLYGSDDTQMPLFNGERVFDLKDFKVGFEKLEISSVAGPYPGGVNRLFYQMATLKNAKESFTYKATNGNVTKNERSEDVCFASDNRMKPGSGVLLTVNNTYFTNADYQGMTVWERPEQHLVTRMANYGETSKRKMRLELRSNVGVGGSTLVRDISPQFKVSIDGMTGYPIGISHDWHDEVTTLTLMEI